MVMAAHGCIGGADRVIFVAPRGGLRLLRLCRSCSRLGAAVSVMSVIVTALRASGNWRQDGNRERERRAAVTYTFETHTPSMIECVDSWTLEAASR